MATQSSILAWRIPWTEEPGRLQSTGSQRVRHDRATNTFTYILKRVTKVTQSHTLIKFQGHYSNPKSMAHAPNTNLGLRLSLPTLFNGFHIIFPVTKADSDLVVPRNWTIAWSTTRVYCSDLAIFSGCSQLLLGYQRTCPHSVVHQ